MIILCVFPNDIAPPPLKSYHSLLTAHMIALPSFKSFLGPRDDDGMVNRCLPYTTENTSSYQFLVTREHTDF
jgi:hypothetical protein